MKESGKFVGHTSRLVEGDIAPYFEGSNEHGELIKLTDFKTKKLLVYFYPKDNTPTCTIQACAIRDQYSELTNLNVSVIGISADSVNSHSKFSKKHNLPFSLLSDQDLRIIKAYDVWGTKQLFGRVYEGIVRTSFLVSEEGRIEQVIRQVESKRHVQQIVKLLQK